MKHVFIGIKSCGFAAKMILTCELVVSGKNRSDSSFARALVR